MNKYQEEFNTLVKLNPLDNRERLCLNYGIEKGKMEGNKDFELLLKSMKEAYPMFKAAYVDFDVFLHDVMNRFEREKQALKQMGE